MKTKHLTAFLILVLVAVSSALVAQSTIKEFVEKTGKEKIKKSVIVTQSPVTAGGFSDGHGRNPVLTNTSQIPDTMALVSFYINDFGTTEHIKNISISNYWITPEGGNLVATQIEARTINALKASFLKEGIVLLTPQEYLNTPAKRDYYYNKFVPKVSKLGKFLGDVETKKVDTQVSANYYRPFDIAVAYDVLRAESLIDDLGKNIGVKGMVTVAVYLQTDKRNINLQSVRMAINGPNPIPKEDKKYVAQNMGNGYYYGQIYSDCHYDFAKLVEIGEYENVKTVSKKSTFSVSGGSTVHKTQSAEIVLDLTGMETLVEVLAEKSFETMRDAIEKAVPKYRK